MVWYGMVKVAATTAINNRLRLLLLLRFEDPDHPLRSILHGLVVIVIVVSKTKQQQQAARTTRHDTMHGTNNHITSHHITSLPSIKYHRKAWCVRGVCLLLPTTRTTTTATTTTTTTTR